MRSQLLLTRTYRLATTYVPDVNLVITTHLAVFFSLIVTLAHGTLHKQTLTDSSG